MKSELLLPVVGKQRETPHGWLHTLRRSALHRYRHRRGPGHSRGTGSPVDRKAQSPPHRRGALNGAQSQGSAPGADTDSSGNSPHRANPQTLSRPLRQTLADNGDSATVTAAATRLLRRQPSQAQAVVEPAERAVAGCLCCCRRAGGRQWPALPRSIDQDARAGARPGRWNRYTTPPPRARPGTQQTLAANDPASVLPDLLALAAFRVRL